MERDGQSEVDERETLIHEMLALQAKLEASFVTDLIEPVLNLRLTMQQLKVLAVLIASPDDGDRGTGSTVQRLAKSLGVSLATMSGIVDRLESQGMVNRTIDPHDQRIRRVLVTDTGRDTMQQLLMVRPELRHGPLQKLKLEDLRALAQGIRALLEIVESEMPQ